MTNYKVFFHVGNDLGLKTKVKRGIVVLNEVTLRVDGAGGLSIPLDQITEAKLFRLHGLGRVIQIDHSTGRLFLSVIRLMIGQFAFINFAETGKLHQELTNTFE